MIYLRYFILLPDKNIAGFPYRGSYSSKKFQKIKNTCIYSFVTNPVYTTARQIHFQCLHITFNKPLSTRFLLLQGGQKDDDTATIYCSAQQNKLQCCKFLLSLKSILFCHKLQWPQNFAPSKLKCCKIRKKSNHGSQPKRQCIMIKPSVT